MRDHIIRQAFHQSVLKTAHEDVDTFVLDEFGLKNGSNRADIAVLNGKLVGYEIKTENDTLMRLSSQVDAYSEVFDLAYIITVKKHLHRVLDQIPQWWGIYLIEQVEDTAFLFSLYRPSQINKRKNTYGIAQLLWKNELVEVLLKIFDFKVSYRTTKRQMYEILSHRCSSKKLGVIALSYLKNRQGWRINQKQS